MSSLDFQTMLGRLTITRGFLFKSAGVKEGIMGVMTAMRWTRCRALVMLASVVICGCAGTPTASTKSAGAETLPETLPSQTSRTAKLGEPCLQARFESSCQEPFSCSGPSETEAKGICFAVQKIGDHCDGHLYRCPQFTQECPPGHNQSACQNGVCKCMDR